jgi:hypothetical protein
MKQQDDIWLKQWKDCLEDFEEEVPVNGWERLQADLQTNVPFGQVEASKAKVIPFRTWRVVAAAAVVVLIAGAGIWFLTSDKAPQVPSVESPVAQVAQMETQAPMLSIATPENAEEEVEASEEATSVPAKQERMQTEKPVQKVAAKVESSASIPSVTSNPATQTSSKIAQASAPVSKTEETKSEGTPIQVRNINRSQAQRSVEPMALNGNAVTSDEVSTVNRRQVRVSSDERMHNVTRLRSQGDATTRSVGNVTDMDRVFNSYTAHYSELYNKTERLFDNGAGDYSTVDNALFLVGLVKKMQSQRSAADEQLYREIASRFVELQQPNGLWKNSLLDPTSRSVDTDTESYICYALAWGLNNGLLNRKQYLEAVRHAWKSIGNCNSEPCLMAAEQVQKLQ